MVKLVIVDKAHNPLDDDYLGCGVTALFLFICEASIHPFLVFLTFKSGKDSTQILKNLKSSNFGLFKGPHIFGEAMTWWLDEILLRKLLSLEKSQHSLMTFHHHHHHHHFQNIEQTASNGKVASITFVFPAVLFVSCTKQ